MSILSKEEQDKALSETLRTKIAAMSPEEVTAKLAYYDSLERLEKLAADEEVGGAFMKIGRDQAVAAFGGHLQKITKTASVKEAMEKASDEQKAEALEAVEGEISDLGNTIAEGEAELVEARGNEASEEALPEKEAQDLAALRAYEQAHPGELAKMAREKLASEGFELVESK